jgi:FixJ family two-component response regulator
MTDARSTIFLVDDDVGVLKALTALFVSWGYDVQSFSSSRDFLARHDPSVPGCAVFDVAMPDLDGLELQAALTHEHQERPVIFITGVGDIPTTVRAMRAGAIDFLTKPVGEDKLLDAIARATNMDAEARRSRRELESIISRLALLTPREYEILTHVISGRLNKQIAYDLGTVVNTIKVHRGRVMEKLGVRSVAELVTIAQRVGIRPATANAVAGLRDGIEPKTN